MKKNNKDVGLVSVDVARSDTEDEKLSSMAHPEFQVMGMIERFCQRKTFNTFIQTFLLGHDHSFALKVARLPDLE